MKAQPPERLHAHLLQRCFAKTSTGIQVIGISGEPGIGKSRLLHEFRQSIGKANLIMLGHAAFLAPDRASYITRQVVQVDGGLVVQVARFASRARCAARR
jgi:putative protein kinase ArgK-like GTPase of G3E family